MDLFGLALILIIAVLVSAVVDQILPKISTPLVQIAIGVFIALFVQTPIRFEFDPELFLVLFIAPLLFLEAKEVDKLGFWKNKAVILSLAIGLVVAITFAVGFSMHALLPAVPLAACLALGAALGPTDAVAVSALSGSSNLSQKQKATLQGESLINDASGLVAFQFAITFALTGEFSAQDAAAAFALEFFGGIAFGIACGWVAKKAVEFIQNRGFDDNTFHILFDLALPFIIYLAGSSIHVSGVLAVVAAGVVFQLAPASQGAEASKIALASESVWKVVAFALNGIVFVMLGMMLPGGMTKELEDAVTMTDWSLLIDAGILVAIIIAVRFLWVFVMEKLLGNLEDRKKDGSTFKHAAVMAFSGAKGTITLSIVMTTPFAVSGRTDIIFLASCAILGTLVLANFIVPLLAPAPKDTGEDAAKAEAKAYTHILRRVVNKLSDDLADADDFVSERSYAAVIDEYNARIAELNDFRGTDDDSGMRELRSLALGWQAEEAQKAGESGEFSRDVAYDLTAEFLKAQRKLDEGRKSGWSRFQFSNSAKTALKVSLRSIGIKKVPVTQDRRERNRLKARCRQRAVDELTALVGSPDYRAEDISELVTEYSKALNVARQASMSVTQFIKIDDRTPEVRRKALSYEMTCVTDAFTDGRIDRKTAAKFRQKVAMMQIDAKDD